MENIMLSKMSHREQDRRNEHNHLRDIKIKSHENMRMRIIPSDKREDFGYEVKTGTTMPIIVKGPLCQ